MPVGIHSLEDMELDCTVFSSLFYTPSTERPQTMARLPQYYRVPHYRVTL